MKRTVSDDLIPNLKNLSREFINAMKEIMYDKYYPNFYFEFREDKVFTYMKKIIIDFYGEDYYNSEYKMMIDDLKNKNYDNNKPVLIINDYKKFLSLLLLIYKEVVKQFFIRTSYSSCPFPRFEIGNYLKNIWLRMTPLDFNDPLIFLKNEYLMLIDQTLSKYNDEQILGKLKSFNDDIITIKNIISHNWDENSKELRIKIFDNDNYDSCYYINLPVVRYGIYSSNGKKICRIGSIQNIEFYKDSLSKYVDKVRYKLNSNIDKEYIEKVEPKNILSLSILIDILNKEGIYDIEIPSMYVLDYEYHRKYYKKLLDKFNEEWTLDKKKNLPRYYDDDKKQLSKVYKKQDLISEIKIERLIKTIERLMIHYNTFKIKSYPNELDNKFHIEFKPFTKDNINNDILKEIYDLVENSYKNMVLHK